MSNVITTDLPSFFWEGFGGRLGDAIRRDYGGRGLAEYCRKTGIVRRTVERYVSGDSLPDLKALGVIISGLSCDPVWLVFGDVELGGLVMERGMSYNASSALAEAERRMREAAEALAKAREELGREGRR
jgi:hypothetical protein